MRITSIKLKCLLSLILITLIIAQPCLSQNQPVIPIAIQCPKLERDKIEPDACPTGCKIRNGIVVGDTKIFDERSLALKLQAIEASLANLQFFDQQSLSAAIGKIQGANQETSAFAFRASTLPTARRNDKNVGHLKQRA